MKLTERLPRDRCTLNYKNTKTFIHNKHEDIKEEGEEHKIQEWRVLNYSIRNYINKISGE